MSGAATLSPTEKVLRECVRPFRQLANRIPRSGNVSLATPPAVAASTIADFHPHDCTVEPEGIELIKALVRKSQMYSGPIIEVGSLLGITTTEMALAKAPEQHIVAVDNFCWNPWGLSPDTHHALAKQVLHYLIETSNVELVRVDKNEFFANYEGPAPSMVFLDAIHDYEETKKDIEWAKRVGAKIISGHDYCDKFPGVIQIVDEHGGPRLLRGSVWAL
ncbi:MAG: hypothetical protein AAGF31_08660 [Planctomycetota bacterium]